MVLGKCSLSKTSANSYGETVVKNHSTEKIAVKNLPDIIPKAKNGWLTTFNIQSKSVETTEMVSPIMIPRKILLYALLGKKSIIRLIITELVTTRMLLEYKLTKSNVSSSISFVRGSKKGTKYFDSSVSSEKAELSDIVTNPPKALTQIHYLLNKYHLQVLLPNYRHERQLLLSYSASSIAL